MHSFCPWSVVLVVFSLDLEFSFIDRAFFFFFDLPFPFSLAIFDYSPLDCILLTREMATPSGNAVPFSHF